jgi:two-component system chemotaxis sensor kinase CheA
LFGIEAEEHLQAIIATLLALEKGAAGDEESRLLETLFREVHTLKGAARAVNLGEIETICQAVEGVCAGLKRREWRVWPELFDTLHRAMDLVRQLSTLPDGPAGRAVTEMVDAVTQLEAQGRAQKADAKPELSVLASQECVSAAVSQVEQTAPESQSVRVVVTATDGGIVQQHQEATLEERLASPEAKKTRRRRAAVEPENTPPRRPRTPKKKVARAETQEIALAEKPAAPEAELCLEVLAETPPQMNIRDDLRR